MKINNNCQGSSSSSKCWSFFKTESNSSLSHIQKVTEWIQKLPESRNDDDDESNSSHLESRNLILMRCDFNKSTVSQEQTKLPELPHLECSEELLKYIANNKDNIIKQVPFQAKEIQDAIRIEQDKLVRKELRSMSKTPVFDKRKFSIAKSDVSSDCQSNMDSQKRELCSYLKLMDPTDKKDIADILQNRRSTRVKNLAAMQEKKQLEIKNLKEQEEKAVSVKDLNTDNDDSSESDLFQFPFPPTQYTNESEHFDNIMSVIIPQYKQILDNNDKNKVSVKNKENLASKMSNSILLRSANKQRQSRIAKATQKNNNNVNNVKNKSYESSRTENSPKQNGRLSHEKIGLKQQRKLPVKSPKQQKTKNNKKPSETITSSNQQQASQNCLDRKTPMCEIVSVSPSTTEGLLDLENLMDDISDFELFSEEHKKSLLESRIFSTKPLFTSLACIKATPPHTGFSHDDIRETEMKYNLSKSVSDLANKKTPVADYESEMSTEECSANSNNEANVANNYTDSDNDDLLSDDHSSLSKNNCTNKLDPVFQPNDKGSAMNSNSHNENATKNNEPKEDNSPLRNNQIEIVVDVHIDSDNCNSHIKEQPVNSEEHFSEDFSDDTNSSSTSSITTKDNKSEPLVNRTEPTAGCSNDDSSDDNSSYDSNAVAPKPPRDKADVDGDTINKCCEINPTTVTKNNCDVMPYDNSAEFKSLQKSLQFTRKRHITSEVNWTKIWGSDVSKFKNQSHFINLNKKNGSVLQAFYVDYYLVVCQEVAVSFWMQTPLGNILGSQNMWIPRGSTQRILLSDKSVQKDSKEMVIATEGNIAYVELWTKEHKSDIRERPVADIFVTIYFWKHRQIGIDKKVLQLENINGFADDVQYCVVKNAQKIIVSWQSIKEGAMSSKKTYIRGYSLASDYQTISNSLEIEPVSHYIASLHNVGECDELIMGCGENKITLWNLEFGYIIATIVLNDVKMALTTHWAKCDRGFLFAVQQCIDRELRLIAINGITCSWKKLASYVPPEGFENLKGVCVENGLLISYYDQGLLYWMSETGKPLEQISVHPNLRLIPSGSYIILLEEDKLLVKHAATHLLSIPGDNSI